MSKEKYYPENEVLYTFCNTTSQGSECYIGEEAKNKIEEFTGKDAVVIGDYNISQQASS